MVILRQKIYAKKDYEGLDYLGKRDLKKERRKIARDLIKAKKDINKHYTSKKYNFSSQNFPLKAYFINPHKVEMRDEISGNKENRDRYLEKAVKYAEERASVARKNALEDTRFRKSYLKSIMDNS